MIKKEVHKNSNPLALNFLVLVGIFRFFKIKYIDVASHSFYMGGYYGGRYTNGRIYIYAGVRSALPDIHYYQGYFWGIQLQFEKEQVAPEATVSLKVEDSQENTVYQATMPINEIGSGGPLEIVFDHIEQNAKERFISWR